MIAKGRAKKAADYSSDNGEGVDDSPGRAPDNCKQKNDPSLNASAASARLQQKNITFKK